MRYFLFVAVLTVFSSFSYAQCPVMPQGFLCITQAAGNVAAENKRELDATKEKVTVLETSLIEKDKTIAELKTTARQNETDLKLAIANTQTQLGTATGQLIGAQAEIVRQTATIQFLLTNGRKKCNGLCIQF